MSKLIAIMLLAASISTYGGAALAHATHGQPEHGGFVAEAGEAQFEIVAKAGKLTVFVTSHGAPLATVGATGKLTVMAGTNKQEIELKPDGDNRMAGQGDLPPEAKLLVAIQMLGKKPLQARAVAK